MIIKECVHPFPQQEFLSFYFETTSGIKQVKSQDSAIETLSGLETSATDTEQTSKIKFFPFFEVFVAFIRIAKFKQLILSQRKADAFELNFYEFNFV